MCSLAQELSVPTPPGPKDIALGRACGPTDGEVCKAMATPSYVIACVLFVQALITRSAATLGLRTCSALGPFGPKPNHRIFIIQGARLTLHS